MRANPFGGLHPLDLPLTLNGGTPGTVCLGPNEIPWSVFSRGMAFKAIGSIVILYSLGEVCGLTDVKLAAWILQHVNPEHRIDAPQVRLELTNLEPSGLTARGLAVGVRFWSTG